MRKLICFFIITFTSIHFSYSQDNILDDLYKPNPVHFLKIDVFKSISSRLHFDYEYYNGKKIGIETGVNVFYPNRVLSFINEDLVFNNSLFAFHYKGIGGELKVKIYFPVKHLNLYFAPMVSYDSKYFHNEDVFIIDGFRSSSYSYSENWSGKQIVAKAFLITGFVTKLNKGFAMDINGGIGIGHFDDDMEQNSTTLRYTGYQLRSEHRSYYFPQLHLSAKLCIGLMKRAA
jgi:hypothetical protein